MATRQARFSAPPCSLPTFHGVFREHQSQRPESRHGEAETGCRAVGMQHAMRDSGRVPLVRMLAGNEQCRVPGWFTRLFLEGCHRELGTNRIGCLVGWDVEPKRTLHSVTCWPRPAGDRARTWCARLDSTGEPRLSVHWAAGISVHGCRTGRAPNGNTVRCPCAGSLSGGCPQEPRALKSFQQLRARIKNHKTSVAQG